MDRVINEIKKVASDCKNVPWYLEVLRQGVNLGEDTIKDESEKEKAKRIFEEMVDDGLFEEDEQE